MLNQTNKCPQAVAGKSELVLVRKAALLETAWSPGPRWQNKPAAEHGASCWKPACGCSASPMGADWPAPSSRWTSGSFRLQKATVILVKHQLDKQSGLSGQIQGIIPYNLLNQSCFFLGRSWRSRQESGTRLGCARNPMKSRLDFSSLNKGRTQTNFRVFLGFRRSPLGLLAKIKVFSESVFLSEAKHILLRIWVFCEVYKAARWAAKKGSSINISWHFPLQAERRKTFWFYSMIYS